MQIKKIFAILAFALLLASCSAPRQIIYFQDFKKEGVSDRKIAATGEIRVQPGDKVSILVNSRDPLLMNLFNLPIIAQQVGTENSTSTARGISGYTVNKDGNINFPVLGTLRIEGMTREEIAAHIKEELISRDLVKDPVVTVEFMNLAVSVLGEVTRPGRYSIDKERVSILDALSMAGDLTIYGKRANVMVMREQDGVQHIYTVDLRSADSVYSSPVYYLRQNDVVYVEPNGPRVRQSTVNGNNIRSTSFWVSIASLGTSIALLFLNYFK